MLSENLRGEGDPPLITRVTIWQRAAGKSF
jgi:hypothetical protein